MHRSSSQRIAAIVAPTRDLLDEACRTGTAVRVYVDGAAPGSERRVEGVPTRLVRAADGRERVVIAVSRADGDVEVRLLVDRVVRVERMSVHSAAAWSFERPVERPVEPEPSRGQPLAVVRKRP